MIRNNKFIPAFLDCSDVPELTRIEFLPLDDAGRYRFQMWSHDRLLESYEGGPEDLDKYIRSTVVSLLPVAYDPAEVMQW